MKNKESDVKNSASVENENNSENEDKSSKNDENSSNKSLLEIRLNEYVKKSEISDFDLRALVVRCSSCGRQINHYSNKEVRRHRKLGVITCRDCYEFYGSSEFSQDESGYNYCTWCGNGGKLIVCDYCPNGFCSSCIRRNFGRAEISVTTREGWKCYCCNKTRLNPKVNFCNLIMNSEGKFIKKEKKERKFNSNRNNISEDWLQTAFNESDEACKNFHKKMSKLKAIGANKSKSLKHVVKKMEEVFSNHKTELKHIMTSLVNQFETYMKIQVEQSKNCDSDCVILDDSTSKGLSGGETNDAPVPNLATQDNANKYDEKKIQAKLSLLKSSSESEEDKVEPTDESVSLLDADSQCNGHSIVKNNRDHDSDISATNNSANTNSDAKINAADGNVLGKKVNRKLSFDFSNSSDSDFDNDKPNVDKLIENVEEMSEIENVEEMSEREDAEGKADKKKTEGNSQKEVLLPETDPKLKLEPKVELIRCDHLLTEGETSLKIGDDTNVEEKLDRLINSLCKFPLKKKSIIKKKQKCGPLSAKKAAAKRELMESSSSISLSSEEDEDQKKIIGLAPSKNTVFLSEGKQMNSDSSSGLSLGSDAEEEKASKKSKISKKAENSNSSDDFVPFSKKRKYDKLLHGPLLSDDEKKPKEKKEKKEATRKRRVLLSSEEENKQKRKSDKSDSSTTSGSEDCKKKKQPKKRRRIKQMGSSSDEEEDGEKLDSTPGKGRKNIRKIVSQKNLANATKEAQLEEKERRKRITDRQKLYNKIEDMSVDGKEVITRKMVLEVDQNSKEEIVEIHPDLVCKLKPHQVNGVKFMWECTIESVKDLDKPGSGCILAHCMGLGKTLQVIAFLHTCLTNSIVNKKITRGMVICPYNTALNWVSEFDFWLEGVENNVKVHQLTTVKSNCERMDILKYWFKEGGVVIVSYDIFRRLTADKIAKLKPRERNQVHKHLLDPGPDIVVCDEGHVLKNDKSAISVATNKLNTRRRIVLTGTPLQNNLKEYHCMLSFVKPNLLGTAKEFRNRFVNPIINGQYDDSNDYDVKLMKKRIHILHKLLEGCVQRCDYSALTKFLPTKHEFVISVKLSEIQIKMYKCYLERRMNAQKDMKSVGKSLFIDFNNLRCIWTHPYICHVSHKKAEIKRMFKDDDEEQFINDSTEQSGTTASSSTSDEDQLLAKIENDRKKDYRTRSKEDPIDDKVEEITEDEKQWYHEFISDDDQCNVQLSGKMVLLIDILKECETIGDKIIVFSQSLLCLDCIEDMLAYCSSQPLSEEDKTRDAVGTWIKGLDYFRMDGGTSVDFRKSFIDMFNDLSNDRARLFLISTRAGSLGTNLVGANRVVIMDTSWNPSHDVQAIFRVYRFGQLKPVYIYRLLAQGTMEEKIYDRQVTKLSLSCRVVDEQQIDRHFSAADLAELYMFDPNATTNRPTPMVPRDRLLAEMLIKNNNWIVTYHEHDSLLQNQTEEDLTEEERQTAWTEYENEREGRLPAVNNTGFNAVDLSSFTREPDFSRDYEGRIIPDLNQIVESLFERLKVQAPDSLHSTKFKELLLSAVYTVRQAFLEKHVKMLRKKQEFCSHGTVPNSLNKYLEELTQSLKSTGEYLGKLNLVIQTDKAREAQKLAQQQQSNANYLLRMQNILRNSPPNQQQQSQFMFQNRPYQRNFPQSFAHLGQRPQFTAPQPTFNVFSNMHTYAARNRQPTVTVTEVSDNDPEPVSNSSTSQKKSTVIIEEIS